MKKQAIVSIALLLAGLGGGILIGSIAEKSKMKEKSHDQVVMELNKVSDALIEASAEFYAGRAYNERGEYHPEWAKQNGAESVIWFVSGFLDNYCDKRRIDGTMYSVKSMKQLRDGGIPQPTNTEYYHFEIQNQAQLQASSGVHR